MAKKPTLDLGVDAVKEVSYNSGLFVKILSVLIVRGLDLLLSSTVFFINISFSFSRAAFFLSSLTGLKGSNDRG